MTEPRSEQFTVVEDEDKDHGDLTVSPVMKEKSSLHHVTTRRDGNPKPTYTFGAPPWKESLVARFRDRKFIFISRTISEDELTAKFKNRILIDRRAEIFLWGHKQAPHIHSFIEENNLNRTYIEDGFIHSVGPVNAKTPPLSLVFDKRTPHYDATKPSDLECLLNEYDFAGDEALLERAGLLMASFLEAGLSRYNPGAQVGIQAIYGPKEQRRILVLGEADGDTAVGYGCREAWTCETLLRVAAEENPDAQIIFKPHHSLLRKSRMLVPIPADLNERFLILKQHVSTARALETIDNVYTITSPEGFEALMRGIKVTTLGSPFYSGWGLTDDRQPNDRRQRWLGVREIFAAAYLLYLKYYDGEDRETTPEIFLKEIPGLISAVRQAGMEPAEDESFDTPADGQSGEAGILPSSKDSALPVKPAAVGLRTAPSGLERRKKAAAEYGKIKRILITSDFLMTKETEQASNSRWMLDLLRRPIKQATGILPSSFSSSLMNSQTLSRAHFFELSDIKLDVDATQFWFDDAAVTSESLDYLARHLGPEDLVVGYELSEQLRRLLDCIEVPWVDIWLHPIRFLDDILFAFSASERSVYDAMRSFHIAEDVFYLYADRIRIQSYKGYRRFKKSVHPGSALFVAQTLEDKAVCERGRMLNLLDFKEAFESTGAEYGKVYYSRHPYVRRGDEAILKYVKDCGFAEVVNSPAYHLLSSGKIAKAFSISSSVVYEAKYFGLDTEFLFNPVIRYGERYGQEYLSIYQEFVSSHFWARALSPILPTNNCDRVMYLEGKDKLRDMLNFYWSYRNIDKVEDMRQQLLSVDRKVQSLPVPPKPSPEKKFTREPIKPGRPWKGVLEEIRELMARHDVITFDIFDTLIARPFEKPEDLFDLLTAQMRDISGGVIVDFRKARLEARALVKDGVRGEEITLDERYLAMAEHHGFSVNTAERMMELEKAAEMRLCRSRKCGWSIYRAAVEMGKRIAFVSDTYFPRDFISDLLRLNGYETTHPLFLSSEYGKLKHTGNLYHEVSHSLDVSPESILHIGDNSHADIKMAQGANFSTFHLPRAVESFRKSRLSEKIKVSRPLLESIIRGLIANRLADNPWGLTTPSFVGGDREAFGYALAGPIFFGFAKWVLEQAMKDGIEMLYFLSRDGDIVKRCYDILAPYYPGAPASVYLLASRRGVNVPALRTRDDVLKMLEVGFLPCPVGDLLRNRFGLDVIPEAALKDAGYTSPDDIADHRNDIEKIQALLREVAPEVLRNAQRERELLLAYYAKQGLMESTRKAVVDIGHHGTLQASIAKMVDDPILGGYYFVTDKDIEEHVHALGMKSHGYLADCISLKEKSHPYSCNLLMFEAIFLNDEGSFIRMVRKDDELKPEFLPLDREAARLDFISLVHDAAVAFTRDVSEVLGTGLAEVTLDGESAASGYLGMLATPTYLDACMFNGITFENVYSGRDSCRLILISCEDAESTIRGSLWKEGAKAITANEGNALSRAKALSSSAEADVKTNKNPSL
ncbi:MAG: hypothetical protein AB9866_16670 [Syntrophobacteraceae bacterium]